MSNQESDPNSSLIDKQNKKPKKKYDPVEYYIENSFIDCKDSINSWCTAKIIERDDRDHTLRINFDGWSHKWDEVQFSITYNNFSGLDSPLQKLLHLESILMVSLSYPI
jgi:hypothetical protein